MLTVECAQSEEVKKGYNPEFAEEDKTVYIWVPDWEVRSRLFPFVVDS